MQPSRPGSSVQYLCLHLRAAAILAVMVGGPIALFLWYLSNSAPDNSGADTLGLAGMIGGPLLAAAICGYLLGRVLIAPQAEHDGWWAALLGLRVGLLLYAVMGGLYALFWSAQTMLGIPPFGMSVERGRWVFDIIAASV